MSYWLTSCKGQLGGIRTSVVFSTDLQDELTIVEDKQEGSGCVVLRERGRLEVELAGMLVVRILKKATKISRNCDRHVTRLLGPKLDQIRPKVCPIHFNFFAKLE